MLSQGEALGKAVVGMARVLAEAFNDPRTLAAALVHPNGEASPVVLDVKAVRELTSAIKDLAGALEASGGSDSTPCGVVILPQAEAESGAEVPLRADEKAQPNGVMPGEDDASPAATQPPVAAFPDAEPQDSV